MDRANVPVLEDRFGRMHDYLRISLVDKCNLRCTYCMPEDIRFLPSSQLMSKDEILELSQVFVGLGVRKIRLTGGEPLLRKDFREILSGLSKLPVELALTTNGVYLHEFIEDLKAAGLRSINISLDSLRPERVLEITRRDSHGQVWRSIEQALAYGMGVKLNMVVMRGVNDDELLDFVELSRRAGLHIRFIEFMPFDGNRWAWDRVMSYAEVLSTIQAKHPVERLQDAINSTSKAYRLPGGLGTFAVISSVTSPFCGGCNRIRLTADGKIRNCLFAQTELDLLGALRNGQAVEALIRSAVLAKAEKLGGLPDFSNQEALQSALSPRAMVKIGG